MKPRPETLRSAELAAPVLIMGVVGARFLALGSETTAQMTTADPIKAESASIHRIESFGHRGMFFPT